MPTANKKQIKPLVSIIPIEPKDVERFWPLCEFMVAEALAFSGKYAESSWVYEELKKDNLQCWLMFGSDESEENKVFGTKMRSVINGANETGITDIVDQQFDIA